MLKAIVFDCGGVFVAPTTGDWLLTPRHAEALGADFIEKHLSSFRRVRPGFMELLPDTNRLNTDDEERALFEKFYAAVFQEMGLSMPEEAIARLSQMQVYDADRYVLFDDVLPWLEKWKRAGYLLGIVSDAPPSTRRLMTAYGVMAFIDGATFSSDLGVLKPDPRIYQNTLRQLDVAPEESVFVDDFPSKLKGGVTLGMKGVQMRREMPALFNMPPVWDGPVARNFDELDEAIHALSR